MVVQGIEKVRRALIPAIASSVADHSPEYAE